ncbi:MAG: PQQ-binding-like beta-propeller repeat protein, partial [Armatimonadetes bacterium]|nr:PQQ-binding-like beta-propeller repeat protein [Armatimonadota bacterium]
MRGILGPWSAVRVGLGLLAAVPRLAADPLQIEHPAFGGQVVPARAVPVDMVSEVLEATMVPRPAPTKATLGPPTPCEARVRVEYHLRADQTLAVPILFPSFGPMEAVSIRLNEDAVAVQIRDDVVVLQPYEAAWRAVIDHAVAGDARLRSAAAEARESRRRLHEQPPPPRRAGGPPRPQMDTWTFSRLMPALNRWWRARGVPEKEAQALSWSLAHHVLDDWPELAVWPTHGVAEAKRVSDRIRLWSERRLATHLDAKTPDPVALWQGLEPNPELQPMSFVAGSLRLRQGDNTLLVEYRQPVSTVNRPAPPSPKRYGSHIQLPQFGFILRTARYWRSFGQFSVDLRLPAGTRWAECSLPGAAVQTRADPPRVSYRGTGLPAENLTVVFGAEAPGPVPTAPERRGAGSAPTVKLSVLWEVTVTRGSGFGHAVPVVDAEHVVAGAGREGVILQRASGRLLRRFSTDDDVASLLLDGGSLFVGGNVWARNGKREGISVVACYDVVTGQRRWRTELPAQEEVSGGPKLRKLGQLVLGSAGAVFALAATDGAVRWQQPFATTGVALSPEAAAGRPDGLAYVAGRPGRQRFRNGRPCDPGCV